MEQLEAIERGETLGQKVYARLRRALIGGAFQPGERLTIRSLARLMEVSPTPAREALNRLVAEGALEFEQNRTYRLPRLYPERARELYDIRVPLEEMAARAAFPHLGRAHIDMLKDNVVGRIAALDRDDFGTSLQLNRDFIFAILEAAQLPIALRILESLWLLAGPMLHLCYPEYAIDRIGIQRANEQIAAIEAGDVEALCHALRVEREEAATLIIAKLERSDTR
ncbi:MAG TPA: GntR family transcriptional regulator [Vineibacter sp.]|nr:GntR family transcriptional regulator [Vineibacter sp.]